VVGFILTGIIIGPYSTALIKNTHDIEIFAEIGVVLMMFIIGIEFSIKKLIRIKNIIFLVGGGQVILTVIFVLAVSFLLDFTFAEGLFFGFLVSLSSTAIVLKLLQDKRQLDSPHGKIELGILLFQDLCVVPMVIITPILALKEGTNITANLIQIGIAFISINIIFFLSRKLMPLILHVIVKTRLKEIFILASLFLCIGMAFVTNYLGLSLALGSFIAGIIISESRYSHQVIADILPFKESFNSIFFISIGMLLNLDYVFRNLSSVLFFGFGIFLLKAAVIFILVISLKYPVRIAIISAMGLAQIGEFSFVLAKLGLQYNILTDNLFQGFLAASVLTMIFTPFAFTLSPTIASRAEKRRLAKNIKSVNLTNPDYHDSKLSDLNQDEHIKLENHVIIVGYGLNGKNLAAVLKRRKIPFAIIELNPDNVIEAENRGEIVIYGDATKAKILEEASIKTAKTITFAISDSLVIDHAVATARFLNPMIYIIARTKYVTEIDLLYELGADTVFAEEYETSIEILAKVMSLYGLSKESINNEINILHQQRYAMIRDRGSIDYVKEDKILTERIHQKIHESINIDSYTIVNKCKGEGKSIAELNIRANSGATIISIVRNEEHFSNPNPEFKLKEGDVVILMGTFEQIEKAVDLLK
jgi:CPA2 family monovalent cation:H+ antiporter-2